MKFLKGFLMSLQFLTVIPIKASLPVDQKHMERSIQSFPLLGLFQGILYSGILYVFIECTPFSPLTIALVICLLTFFITGGLHLDGWMDASDAYFSYQDHRRKLEIMADSRTGAFGVISLLVLLSTRFLFIYEIIIMMDYFVYFLIVMIPFLCKVLLGYILIFIPTAKEEGMAFFLKKASTKRTFMIYPLYIVALIASLGMIEWQLVLFAFVFVFVAAGIALFIQSKAIKWFGGITGDVLGASMEGTENILWMTLWLLLYFVMG